MAINSYRTSKYGPGVVVLYGKGVSDDMRDAVDRSVRAAADPLASLAEELEKLAATVRDARLYGERA